MKRIGKYLHCIAILAGVWFPVLLCAQDTAGPGLRVSPTLPGDSFRLNRYLLLDSDTHSAQQPSAVKAQPRAYNFQQLSLFCKLEVHIEKAVKLPVRLRLGDVQYVDWLEGKRRSAY